MITSLSGTQGRRFPEMEASVLLCTEARVVSELTPRTGFCRHGTARRLVGAFSTVEPELLNGWGKTNGV